ncbi:glucokinase [Mangrovitalea sediminis]|uniref:glucokinase n=1 Tax=Mangrovitalea sediminis TaxID=1982043 RepID=UPI000BE52166|nr:glucokinase [Mangrovitalea sediminis]
MTDTQYALVGDIGGTNARFALVQPGSVELEQIQVLPCSDYANLDGAVADYLQRANVESVSQACMAFACPVHGERIRLTNNHWSFDRNDMQQRLDLTTFKIINDFTAMALGVPHVSHERLVKIGGGEGDPARPRLVIGPGTGLGVSGLVRTKAAWVALSTEGGHVDFSPRDDVEFGVLRILRERFGRVSVERILCGQGLVNLYQALAELESRTARFTDPGEITRHALENDDALARETLTRFCEILGRVAGNGVLTLGALGGVYICGGIIPRFIDFFRETPFRAAFEDKGRMRGYMESVPVYVVTETYAGLLGAAEALTNDEV